MTLMAQWAYGQCSEPFFSEYIEGSSNNKALEIYNPSGAMLDLSDYQIFVSGNGGSFTNTLDLTGMLAPDSVYIVSTDQADAAILAVADTALGFPSVAHFNGNDAIALVKLSTGDTLDIIGEIGVDPTGGDWPVGTGATSEFTLVRMPSVDMGTTDWTVGATQWLVSPQNTFDSLNVHTSDCATSGGSGCTTDLFFSEYIEGSSNNKALEIYNPLDVAVSLSDYQIFVSGNGGSFTNTLDLTGMLAPDSVYVVSTDQADAAVLAIADTALGFPSVAHFNGNDAIALVKLSTGDTLDIIGEIGVDPTGGDWPVGTGSTGEHTLIRMASINEGTTDWTVGATQWLVFPQDDFDSLGMHTMTPCGAASTDPEVSFAMTTLSVDETVGTASFDISLANAPADTVAVDVMLAMSGSAMSGMDFTWMDTTIVFPASATAPISLDVAIIDDADPEMDETIVIKLMNPTNGASIVGSDSLVITILENDAIIPVYNIGLITEDADANGEPDSLDVVCEIRGIVHGIDLQGSASNIQFTVIDATGGIGVASFGDTYGYTVMEGDSVRIQGVVEEFRGLAQVAPDTIIFETAGNATVAPAVVDSLGEVTESELIRINNVFLADASQWPGSGSANVDIVVNGTDTLTLRIDSDTDVDGSPAPTGLFDVIGIGGQFTFDEPPLDGYQILPRYVQDIIIAEAPGFSFDPTSLTVGEDAGTVTFDVSLANPFPNQTTVSVSLGASSTATDGADFMGWNDTVLTFPAATTGPFQLSLMINDDTDVEMAEEIVIELSTPVGGPVLGDSVLTITIEDNDFPVYAIGTVTADADGNGFPDSLGVRCELRGIVYGMDQQGSNLNFVFIDSTGGIATFSRNDFGYTVNEGDEIVMRGEITEFRGLAQIDPDTLIFVSAGNPIMAPMVVDSLGEFTESEYIRMECMTLVDTADWQTSGSYNIDITNGVDTFTMRIDADVDAAMAARPEKPFTVTGLGWQFTFDDPALSGYQIIPQFINDIEIAPAPVVGFRTDSISVTEAEGVAEVIVDFLQGNGLETSVDIAVDATGTTATEGTDFSFTAGTLTVGACGEDSMMQSISVVDDGVAETDEYVTLILSNPDNDATLSQATLVITIVDETNSINTLAKDAVRMFPNPTRSMVEVEAGTRIESIQVSDLVGKQVMSASPLATEARFSVTELPAGIYTVTVITTEGRWTSKLIRE